MKPSLNRTTIFNGKELLAAFEVKENTKKNAIVPSFLKWHVHFWIRISCQISFVNKHWLNRERVL